MEAFDDSSRHMKHFESSTDISLFIPSCLFVYNQKVYMRRTYHGKKLEVSIYPSGKDQSEVGMFVELEKEGWKTTMFIPDMSLARVLGREMYYSLVCEFFPNDFISRPSTPEPTFVYKRIRRRSSNSRIRKTPQEMGIEAEPYDKPMIDSVESSSNNTDLGEARLRVERTIFQSIQTQECNFDSAEKLWWDIKYRLSLIIVCLKYSLLRIPSQDLPTTGAVFDVWKTHSGLSEGELVYSHDHSLTQLGQALVESVSKHGILYRLIGMNKSDVLMNDDVLKIQNTNTIPEVDGVIVNSLTQSRVVQVILVVVLFGVLVVGVGSFIMENRKVMDMLERIHEKCKS
jgi:hypothetical protein